jgi:hypothetical protein
LTDTPLEPSSPETRATPPEKIYEMGSPLLQRGSSGLLI